MPARRPRPSLALLALGLAAGALTSGCSVSRDDTSDAGASASPSPTATSTVTVTPVATPSASATATPTPTPSSSGAPSPAAPAPTGGATTTGGPLLTAAQLPAVPGSPAWTQERSGPAGTSPFGLCQKADLLSIGAETLTERSFSSGRDTSAQQFARFPDARTALRADRVVQAWHDGCRDRVRASAVRISPVQQVAGASGASAWQYTVTYEVGGDVHAQAFALVRRGTGISLVRLDLSGQADDSAPVPADLMTPVVRAAAARLG
ncbi:MAG: hypothetical protein JWR42_2442 [Marmoricola sp.]|nr:hypothetical protein [Marmoricola sp.]